MNKQQDNQIEPDILEIQKMQDTLNEKDKLIEELENKIRYQDLQFKKKEIELSNELAHEQNHVQQLQQMLTETSQIEKFKKIAEQLEQKLAETEQELLKLKNDERQAQQELLNLEQQNFELKTQLQQRRQSTPQQPQEIQKNNMTSPKTSNFSASKNQNGTNGNQQQIDAIQEDEYEDIDKGELVSHLMQLTKEKEQLEAQSQQIKSGAIDAIMEKEKIILELQEKLDVQSQELNNFNDNQQIKDEYIREIENFEDKYEKLQSEYQNYMQEAQAEQVMAQDLIKNLHQKLEEEHMKHEEIIYSLEKESKERHFENLKDHESNQKLMESQLMKQIEESESKYRQIDKQHQELSRTYEQVKEERFIEAQKLDRLKEDNQKKIQQLEELQLTNKKMSKSIEELDKKSNQKLVEKNQLLEKQTHKLEEHLRRVLELETDIKQYNQLNEQLKTENTDLQERCEQIQDDCDARVKMMTEQREKDFATFQKDLKQYQDNGGEKSLQQEIIQLQDEPSTSNTSTIEQQQNQSGNLLTVSDFNGFSINTPQKNQNLILGSTGGKTTSSKKEYECLRSPRTNIKLQFNEFQKDIKQLKEEKRILEDKNDEIEIENQSLQQEMEYLKQFNQKLQNQNSLLLEEIDKVQKEVQEAQKLRQESRKNQIQFSANNKIDLDQQTKLIQELDETRQHLKKIETHLLTYKLQHVEDKNYLEEELQREHSKNQELQQKLKEITSEKEYLSLKYRKDKKHKRNLSVSEKDGDKKSGWSLFSKNDKHNH